MSPAIAQLEAQHNVASATRSTGPQARHRRASLADNSVVWTDYGRLATQLCQQRCRAVAQHSQVPCFTAPQTYHPSRVRGTHQPHSRPQQSRAALFQGAEPKNAAPKARVNAKCSKTNTQGPEEGDGAESRTRRPRTPPPPWTTPDSRKKREARPGLSAQALAAPKPTKAEKRRRRRRRRRARRPRPRLRRLSPVRRRRPRSTRRPGGVPRGPGASAPRRRRPRAATTRSTRRRSEGSRTFPRTCKDGFDQGRHHGFGVTGTAEVEVETDSAEPNACAEEAASAARVNALPVSSAILPRIASDA